MRTHPKFPTYEDCEKAVQLATGLLPIVDHLPERFRKPLTGAMQAMVVTEAFNEGWEPDYTNARQPKYFVCPAIDADESCPSGFGFSGSPYGHWSTDANCGSRHAFKTSELALCALEQFPEIFKDYILFKR